MSRRFLPSLASCRSTIICVAMPAWSVPGSQSVTNPRMRCQRTMMSICVWLPSMCPRANVTSHIRRWKQQAESRPHIVFRRSRRVKQLFLDPIFRPARYDRRRLVSLRQIVGLSLRMLVRVRDIVPAIKSEASKDVKNKDLKIRGFVPGGTAGTCTSIVWG